MLGGFPDRALTDALYERAEGNPLFTEELLACPDGCALIPDSLADLLQQAVRRLPEDTQEVLRIASAGSGADQPPAARPGHRPDRGRADRRDPRPP